ncbi:MAG: hypothetical protein AAB973_00615, partial [Patescibacteria group bacterium]
EGGSVRRAEELARRFKKQMGGKTKVAIDDVANKSINDLIDQLSNQIQTSIGKNAKVKMRRSRIETAISIVLRGKPEETEQQLKKICIALSTGEVTNEVAEETIPETAAANAAPAFTNPFEPILPIDNPKDEFEDY